MIEKIELYSGEGSSVYENISQIEDKINEIIVILNNKNIEFIPKFKKGDTIKCIKIPEWKDKHNSFVDWIENFDIKIGEKVKIKHDSNLKCASENNPKYETVFVYGVQVNVNCFELDIKGDEKKWNMILLK